MGDGHRRGWRLRRPIQRRAPIKRGKPPSRRPKSEQQKLDDEALRLWSLIVRMRDGECRLQQAANCNRRAEYAHHMVKKSQSGALRFVVENGLALDLACHAYIHDGHCLDEAQEYRDRGVDYDALMVRAQVRGAGKRPDLKLVILGLRQQLAALEGATPCR